MKYFPRLVFVSAYRLTGFGGGVLSSRAFFSALKEIYFGSIVLISSEEDRPLVAGASRESFVGVARAGWIKRLKLIVKRQAFDRMSPEADIWLKYNLGPGDILVVNGAIAGRLCQIGVERGVKKIILIHQNIEADYLNENWSFILGKKLVRGIVEKNQAQGYRCAHFNLFLTEADLKRCQEIYGRTDGASIVAPTFLPPELSTMPSLKEDIDFCNGLKILITGSLFTPQFEKPFLIFLRECWASFKQRFPGSTLTVAGKSPSRELNRLSKALGFNLVADPEDMALLYESANLYLSLTVGGSGKKYRIMEPLRWGLPILASKGSLTGYHELSSLPWIFSYSSSAEVLVAFQKIVDKGSLSLIERRAAQEFYKNNYSYYAGVEILKKKFEKINERL